MRKSKQVIIIRKDLNMRKGKMVAQGSHASLKAILDKMDWTKRTFGLRQMNADTIEYGGDLKLREQDVTDAMKDWLTDKFTKICVSVNSEAELLEVYNKAKEKGLPCSLITDAGLTEFNGVPTLTCCAIGPAWDDEVNEITSKLQLL